MSPRLVAALVSRVASAWWLGVEINRSFRRHAAQHGNLLSVTELVASIDEVFVKVVRKPPANAESGH